MALFNMTNRVGDPDIKAFVVSATGYDCAVDPITTDYELTLYHNGVGTVPAPGDTIYANAVGTIKWTSADESLDRNIQLGSSHLRVDSDGVMIITC